MRRFWGIGGWLLLGLFLGFCVATSPDAEPVYAGKALSRWLDEGFEDASLALQEIGPRAVPYIFAKLAREDTLYGSSQSYRRMWARAPAIIRKVFPKPSAANFDELRACSALLEIGPASIPLLAVGLQDRNPAVREASAHALGIFRQRHQNIGSAVPPLTKALQDSKAQVRMRVAWALGDATAATCYR